MWTMTSNAFTSAVAHRDDTTKLMVRARDYESARNLMLELNEALNETKYSEDDIFTEAKSDYKWRIVVDRTDYAMYVAYEVINYVNYDNFKNAATKARGKEYHDALMRVWVAMHALTRAEEKLEDVIDGPDTDDEVTELHPEDDDYVLYDEAESEFDGYSQQDLLDWNDPTSEEYLDVNEWLKVNGTKATKI